MSLCFLVLTSVTKERINLERKIHLGKNNIVKKIFRFCEWFMVLAWINLLWIIFALLGAVAFGWAPATVAAFNVVYDILKKRTVHFPIFRTFLTAYKAYFLRGNSIGYTLVVLFIAVIYGLFTLPQLPTTLLLILSIFYGVVSSGLVVMGLFSIPVMIYYQTNYLNTFRSGLLIGIAHLPYTLGIVVLLVISYVLFMAVPGTLLFLMFSLPVTIISAITYKALKRVDGYNEEIIMITRSKNER